jgi:pimeloyl-ACP methyl ester carboxylesterase
VPDLYSFLTGKRALLALLVRAGLVLELAIYAFAWNWLHASRGWEGALAAAALAAFALAVRLSMVGFSIFLSWIWRSPRPPEQQLGVAGTLQLVLGEWRAMLADNFFYLPFEGLALHADNERTPPPGLPVLLVHGYLSNRGILRPVVRALESAGVQPVFTMNFRGIFAPVEHFVPQLEERVGRILEVTGQERIVLVCHSMGGLVVRAWMARHGTGRVARLVTIATPHCGTRIAAIGIGANARQMQPGSAFLEALRRNEGDAGPGVAATSIYSLHDNLVAPQDSSRLPWAKSIVLSGLGHVDILLSAELHRALLEELRDLRAQVS